LEGIKIYDDQMKAAVKTIKSLLPILPSNRKAFANKSEINIAIPNGKKRYVNLPFLVTLSKNLEVIELLTKLEGFVFENIIKFQPDVKTKSTPKNQGILFPRMEIDKP